MYPKFVQREPHIGAVLCQNEDEEKQLLGDWKAEKALAAKEAEEAAAKAKKEAEEAAKVVVKK